MGQDTTVPDSPFPTRCPGLCGTGTQLHGPKGCWHSSAGPDPAPLASSLSWGGEVERWLCIHRDALAALWWHAECRWCGAGSNQTFVLLPLAGLSGHHHNSSTTLRPSGAASRIGQAGALGHPSHGSSSTAPTQMDSAQPCTVSHPSTGAGHCFFGIENKT